MTFDEFVAHRLAALLRYATVVSCDAYLAEEDTGWTDDQVSEPAR